MICKKCKGKGDYFYEVYNDGKRRREILVKCDKCNGTGKVKMTNEEWFTNLTTEEKALWLTKETRNSAEAGQWCTKEYWQKWLKAVHHAE